MKDDRAGEIPVAFIMRTEGSEVTEDEIKQFVAKEVITMDPCIDALVYYSFCLSHT
jgi:hypothetical protein